MKQFDLAKALQAELHKARRKGGTVGFVPTMGALHEGHLALIRRSLSENDITVCSIFVNPTQFNNPDDLSKYPRTLQTDLQMLDKTGCPIVFIPGVDEMYPSGTEERLDMDFGRLERIMEGKYRPGHFKGVATVVKKLFDIVEPERAYFGKKDYQQYLVIQQLVAILGIRTEIIPCPIVREADGLAMSSRNMRLTIGERKIAPQIFQVLCETKERTGTHSVKDLKKWAIRRLQEGNQMRVEYFEIADPLTLAPFEKWENRKNAMAFTAVYLGDIRLIDNLELFS
jgi:pantoate--beta-alanine ligase